MNPEAENPLISVCNPERTGWANALGVGLSSSDLRSAPVRLIWRREEDRGGVVRLRPAHRPQVSSITLDHTGIRYDALGGKKIFFLYHSGLPGGGSGVIST